MEYVFINIISVINKIIQSDSSTLLYYYITKTEGEYYCMILHLFLFLKFHLVMEYEDNPLFGVRYFKYVQIQSCLVKMGIIEMAII